MNAVIDSLRRFNRFHTRFVGALDARYLGSDMPLVEARLLYEIATRDAPLAVDLQGVLGLDPGYASRILRRFEQRGWIARGRGADARRRPIGLTDAGRAAFADLDRRQHDIIDRQLAGLGDADRRVLVEALETSHRLLAGADTAAYSVRPFAAGDMGMIAARQAILYDEVYGWGRPMEALLGEVTAGFLRNFREGRDQCWVAESAGSMAGSVFVVDAGDDIAQLRLLYVEPWARGLGIGSDLVERCIAFARAAGYARLRLWTHTVLESARRIYAAAGFAIVETAIHHEFGKPQQGEIWEMPLD